MSWKQAKIGDVCKTGAGGTPLKSRKEFYEGGDIPWLQSGEVSQGEVFKSKKFITEEGLKNSSAKMFPPNTVLVAMYGATAGQVGILRFPASTNQAVCGIFPNDKLLPEFIYYALLSKQAELISKAAGNAQPNISQIKVKNTEIPLISLPEQKRIVAILDEAFAGIDQAIANTEKNLASARELFESYLNTIFTQKGGGWETKPLKNYCSDYKSAIVDGPFGSNLKKEHFVDSGVPVLKIQNIKSYKIIDKKLNYVSEDKALELKRHAFIKGDIVMTKLGNPLGVSAIVEDMEQGVIVADLVRVRADKINTEYLCYQLNSPIIKSFINSKQKGATRPRVKITIVRDLPIAAPSLKQQEKIVGKINEFREQVERTEEIYCQKLTSLNELKQSLLQKAFSGELTADMADEAQAEAAE